MKSVKVFLVLALVSFFSFNYLSAQQKEISFAWITDTHIGYPTGTADLQRIIEEINSNESISFVVHTGDVTEKGKTKELKEAKALLDKLKVKYFVVPGNHDYKWSESGCAEFLSLFNDDKFAFKYNDILFLGLNSGTPLRGGLGHFASHDVNWLNTFLSSLKDQSTPIIFFTHYPVDKSYIDNYYSVLLPLSKMNIQFIGVGHDHVSKAMNFDGLPGVMARVALSKNDNGGYVIVKIREDSILFSEKKVGRDTCAWETSVPRKAKADLAITPKNFNEWKYNSNKKTDVVWSDSLNYSTVAAPVIYDNKILLCDMVGRINCYDNQKGKKLWEYQLDNSIVSTPAVVDGKALIISVDGRIYFFDIETGKIKWQTKFNFPIIGTPVIIGDTAYIGTSEYSFCAIGLNSGNELWSFKDIKAHIESVPVINDDKIFIASWDGYLYSLDRRTGKLIWKWSEEKPNFYYAPAACIPVISNNKIFITEPNKYLTTINIESGKTIYRSNLHPSWESIGISSDKAHVFVKGLTDTLFCYSSAGDSLKLEWFNVLGYKFDTSPVPVIEKNGSVYVAAGNGFLYCVDEKTGKFKWDYFLGESRINTPIILDDGSIIICNTDGVIRKIRSK
jgi:outer membrane protein assembly factor BamB